MKEQIKELRVRIDGLYQLTKELKPIRIERITNYSAEGSCVTWFPIEKLGEIFSVNSKQIEDAAHSLIYAKAWLGKCLRELGAESPYKSGYKTVSDIEPTADKSELVAVIGKNIDNKSYKDFNHIEKVDWLRTEIEKVINEVKQIGNAPNPPMLNREISIARTNAYNHLCEARFALGFEMARVKEEHENKR